MNNNEYYELIAQLIVSKSEIEIIINEYIRNLKIDTNGKIDRDVATKFLTELNDYFVELLKFCTNSLQMINNVINEREEQIMLRRENEFVTVEEIANMSKTLTVKKIMTVVNNRLLRGTHMKYGTYYIPRDIAEDYVFIVDNPHLIRLAVLKRAEIVCKKYETNHVQICRSCDLDSSLLSKLKHTEDYSVTYKTIYKLCQGSIGLRCRISTLVEIAKSPDLYKTNSYVEPKKQKQVKTKKSYDNIDHVLFSIENEIQGLHTRINELEEIIIRVDKTKKDDRRKLKEYNKQNV